jgi:hypothetical protein
VELVKILEKNQRLHIQIEIVKLKMTSCKTMRKKQKVKKNVNVQDSMGKKNFFIGTLFFNPLAMWLHRGPPQ